MRATAKGIPVREFVNERQIIVKILVVITEILTLHIKNHIDRYYVDNLFLIYNII